MAVQSRHSGFTLVELLMATVILSLFLVAATGALLSQNAAYVRGAGNREAREQGVAALDVLEKSIRLAGFGIDPQLAFDFDYYDCTLAGASSSFSAAGMGRCNTIVRDSTTSADALVLYYRDPNYTTNAIVSPCGDGLSGRAWTVTAASPASVTLNLRGNDTLYKGQILQLMCQDAATYTYVTVSGYYSAGSGCVSTTVSLAGTLNATGLTGTIQSPFSQPSLLSIPCFSSGTARAFAVNRNRFFVYQSTANVTAPRPFLMLDQGLDITNASGGPPDGVLDDNDLLPIASDIEDLQVSYVLDQLGILQSGAALAANPGPYILDAGGNGIWGDSQGRSEQLTANVSATAPYSLQGAFSAANTIFGANAPCSNSMLAPYRNPCLFDKPSLESSANLVHPYRWAPWTGNITSVRIGLVGRSALGTGATFATSSADIRFLAPLENRPQVDLVTGSPTTWYSATRALNYQHTYFNGAVRTVNMSSSGLFLF